jgi:hypothetical protein
MTESNDNSPTQPVPTAPLTPLTPASVPPRRTWADPRPRKRVSPSTSG